MSVHVLPACARPSSVFISPLSAEGYGASLRAVVTTAAASAAYPAVQRALFFPFKTYRPETVYRFFWVNGTTASTDNIQVGIYDNAGNSLKLGTSTLASGVSQCQFDNIADYVLPAGSYLLAIWGGGTTTHLIRYAPTSRFGRVMGSFQQSSLASGLPTTATLALNSSGYVPIFGLALRSTP